MRPLCFGMNARRPIGTVWTVSADLTARMEIARLATPLVASVRTFADAIGFLNGFYDSHPSCLVIDQRTRPGYEYELVAEIRRRRGSIAFVVLVASCGVRLAVQAMREGAFDCIAVAEDYTLAVQAVLACLESDESHVACDRPPADLRGRCASLTERERQVLELLLAGATSKAAALHLCLSKKTVDFHRARIIRKLGVGSLIEAAVQLGRHGLYMPSRNDRFAV